MPNCRALGLIEKVLVISDSPTSVTTTQRSYCAMEQGIASRQLRNAWKEHPIKVLKNPVIDRGFDNTGYV